jgi:hypothetical protein
VSCSTRSSACPASASVSTSAERNMYLCLVRPWNEDTSAFAAVAWSLCRPRPMPAANCMWDEASATCHATMWQLRDAPEDPTLARPWEGLRHARRRTLEPV